MAPNASAVDLYVVGARAWFSHPSEGWISAEIVDRQVTSTAIKLVFVDETEQEHIFESSVANLQESALPPLRNPPILEQTEDLTNLSYLNEPAVLHAIRTRYSLKQIYTYSGIVLVAVNPFAPVPLYDSSFIQTYAGRRKSDLEPHLFAIAEEAYRCMLQDNKDQTIIVSGESGAGKTVSAKYIMRFFATVENPDRPRKKPSAKDGMTDVERQILATNPLMEAFGNAKTTRNDNSSRFGKYLEILFDNEQLIIGARMRTYLLERSRLVFQPETERNYHIFYQFLAGAPKSDLASLDLDEPSKFHYLSQGGPNSARIHGVDDAAEFATTQKSLSTIGVTSERQWQVFNLLAALLHIGNIKISQTRNESNIADDNVSLKRATKLLGIDQNEFRKWIVKKQIVTRSDKIQSALTAPQATVVRDSVAKYIYACLFDWLVATINESLTSSKVANSIKSFIGVLDIYGFEHFKKNSFEQFCINYANEKLQQQFNAQVFKIEQNEYTQEEINWTFIDFSDNQPCIDLIEGKLGILALLDEESRLPSGADATFAQKLYTTIGGKTEHSKVFKKPKFGNSAFTVAHYALDVTYETDGFLEKNRDTVPDEQLALLNSTTNLFLKEILEIESNKGTDSLSRSTAGTPTPENGNKRSSVALKNGEDLNTSTNKRSSMLGGAGSLVGGKKIQRKPTLGSIFKFSLTDLMSTITNTNAHYIRCIKPNEDKEAWALEPQMVLSQLRACGVLETIRISTAGYPTRWTFEEFAQRYYMLTNSQNWGPDLENLCRLILESSITEHDKYQIGRTKIFFRAGMLAFMEKLRNERFAYLATVVQKNYRRSVAVRQYRSTKEAIISVQGLSRGVLVRRQLEEEKMNHAALLIQSLARAHVHHQDFDNLRKVAIWIQSVARGKKVRLDYENQILTSTAVTLQCLFRCFTARTEFLRHRKGVVYLQSCVRRNDAKKQLKMLKLEAKSVSHYKEVSYKLENKVVELTQTLQKRTTENKSLQTKISDLDTQLQRWQDKYAQADKEAQSLRETVSRPIDSLPEFQDLEAQKRDLDMQLEKSRSTIETKNEEIKSLTAKQLELQSQLEEKQQQLKDASAAAAAVASNHSNVPNPTAEEELATLRNEVVSLREQLSRTIALNNIERSNRTFEQPVFNMATGRSANGLSPTNPNFPVNNGTGPAAALAKRRQRRNSHSGVPSDPVHGSQDQNFLPDSRDIRAVSVAHPTDAGNYRNGGTGTTDGEIIGDPAEHVIQLLEDEESLDEDILNRLIRHLKIPSATAQHPPSPKEVLFPAHLISLVTNEMWKYGLLSESERFLANVMQYIQNQVMSFEGEEAIAPGSFWHTNIHEIYSFVSIAENDVFQGIGPGVDGEGRDFNWNDYERLVSVVKLDLESLEYNVYHTWMQETKKRLSKMIIPAVLESQSLPGFIVNEGSGRLFNRLVGGGANNPAYTMDDIISLFTKVYKCLASYYIEEDVLKQALRDLFKLIGVTAFNELLTRRNFCSWKRGMQIQYNITRLEEWCKAQELEGCSMPLEHLMQATKLLQLKKGTSEDIEIIYDVCWMLTPTQIHKLITQYYPADYEPPIQQEIVREVGKRVIPGDEADHLLLPPEVEAPAEYELPLPRGVTGIETYIPGWLPLDHIRRLVSVVST